MNYYEKTLKKIDSLIKTSPEEALKIIEEELKAPYVPGEVLDKLNTYKSKIDIGNSNSFYLDEESIRKYLQEDEDKQCLAVQELSKLNLREYEDLISDYLLRKGSLKAKVMLILSLKEQESSRTYSILKDNEIIQFIPKDIVLPEDSEYYKESTKVLNEYYLKNPDMLNLAKELLYNDYIMNLPKQREITDVRYITSKIKQYIDKSFNI